MSGRPRTATPAEVAGLWPAVRSERVFDARERFDAYVAEAPWRARANDRGDGALLGVWREHLGVLAIRGMWCPSQRIGEFVEDAYGVARHLELDFVLSPLLPLDLLGYYRREGMAVCQRITAIQGRLSDVAEAGPPAGVWLREGTAQDLPALVELETVCFDEFWRYGVSELTELLQTERFVAAVSGDDQLIGYTLATESRGAATLGRLGVAPGQRGQGVARALVSDVAGWAAGVGAETLSLCTQEDNSEARALYRSAGLAEVRDTYGFAIGRARGKEGTS